MKQTEEKQKVNQIEATTYSNIPLPLKDRNKSLSVKYNPNIVVLQLAQSKCSSMVYSLTNQGTELTDRFHISLHLFTQKLQ